MDKRRKPKVWAILFLGLFPRLSYYQDLSLPREVLCKTRKMLRRIAVAGRPLFALKTVSQRSQYAPRAFVQLATAPTVILSRQFGAAAAGAGKAEVITMSLLLF